MPAATEAIIAVAEIGTVPSTDTAQLAATLTRILSDRHGPVALGIDAAPFPAALERQHVAVLLTYCPE